MQTFTCDFCGNVIEKNHGSIELWKGTMYHHFDMCPDCHEKIYSYLYEKLDTITRIRINECHSEDDE